MNLSLQGIVPNAGERDQVISCVAVEFGCRTVKFRKAVLKRIKGDPGQVHGVKEGFLHVPVQTLTGDRFNNETENHVIQV